MDFERIDSEEIWQGHIGGVRVDTFRYADGGEAKREVFTHPGAVSILPFDGERIWLVRQPREPVGEPELLELPAGKIDKPGEELEALALRELQEEIGKGARSVRHLCSFRPVRLHAGLRRGGADRDRDAGRGRPGYRDPADQGRQDADRPVVVPGLPARRLAVRGHRRGRANPWTWPPRQRP
jgi:NUDIX domain